MIEAFDAVVVYKDGRRVTAHVGMLEIVGVERRFRDETKTTYRPDGTTEIVGVDAPNIEKAFFGVWLALGRPEGEMDAWLATVETLEDEPTSSAPSEPAPGVGAASKRPSKRASTRRAGNQTHS